MLKAIHVVYADWCPHCVPTVVGPLERVGKEIGVPVILYDIDTDDEANADELVKKYGDWTPDYVIPQVFLEGDDGKITHVLTGNPRGIQLTRLALEALIKKLSKN